MNKSAIALAVAAAVAASAAVQADTTLYGSARVSVDYFSPEDAQDDNWNVVNNSSRLGVRGSEDLGNGLSAIYQYEFGVDTTEGGNLNSNRPRVLGLKGGFGTISLGTQWTPYYNVLGLTDTFNSGKTYANYLGAFRKDNTVNYLSPSWGGFSVEGQVQIDGASGQSGVDTWDANLKYTNGPFLAGVAVEADEELGNALYGLGLGLKTGNWNFGLIAEHFDFDDDKRGKTIDGGVVEGDDNEEVQGLVEYTLGSNILRASYAYADPDNSESEDYYQLGVQHNLSKRSRLWVEYIGFRNSGDTDAVSVGMRHDF